MGDATPPSPDAETFVRALYDDAAGPLFGYVLRLTGDRARAEEVVQETLVRAWRSAVHLDAGSEALRAWLFTTARNLCTDLWRRDAARPATVSDDFALASAPAADELDRAVQRWTVATALARLTPEHRAVLVETYYEGRSVAEAAQRLGVPAGTVKSRTYYALRALRLVLEEMGVAQ
ncbi:RNA polymerase subunit sigma [Pseudonocardia sp. CNS-139]|nr:RNA polymerase subunit sigma [Pseudonocardia sp. CNS-139]